MTQEQVNTTDAMEEDNTNRRDSLPSTYEASLHYPLCVLQQVHDMRYILDGYPLEKP